MRGSRDGWTEGATDDISTRHPTRMRVLFLVQGEGRGHLTQALALAPMLRRAGHEIAAVIVGASPARTVPPFFVDEIGAPVERVDEPGFGFRAGGVDWGRTLLGNAGRLGAFRAALRALDAAVDRYRPDVVVNFYTLLGGLAGRRRSRTVCPTVCIGHQYAFHHPVYPFPAGHHTARSLARAWTDATVPPGARRLALSFYDAPPVEARNLRIVPPLLRDSLARHSVTDDGSLLVYLLHADYAPRVEAWAARHPETRLHVFWDRADAPVALDRGPNLTFHRLDGAHFLRRMAACHALVCTAGFESVCEAMYLGKPALMVPVGGHFEQACNARDAAALGAGLHRRDFDIDALLATAATHVPVPGFRAWADRAEEVIVGEIERAAGVTRGAARAGGDGWDDAPDATATAIAGAIRGDGHTASVALAA